MKKVFKIVVTGGPCAGKTKIIETIKNYYESSGKTVIIIPETSTQVIEMGFKWWDNSVPINIYQNLIFKYQLQKEDIILETIEKSNIEDVILICDRGLLDGKAYMDSKDYDKMIINRNLTYEDIYGRYDLVIYLQSVATKYPNLYSDENNKYRKSNLIQAKEFDKKVKEVWKNHHNFISIDALDNFKTKEKEVIKILKKTNNIV